MSGLNERLLACLIGELIGPFKGAVSLFCVFVVVVVVVVLFQCVPVCVYRLHFRFQRLDAALLRNITLRIHLFTFTSCFVIDLLSI